MGNDVWTIKAALDWTCGYLERKGDENPRLSAQWLLSDATGMKRVDLYTHFDQPLMMEEREVFRDYVARRAAGEPLQYITGEVGFRHISVKVRKGVLIPRPETEVLVSEALAMLPAYERQHAIDSQMTEAEAELALAALGEGDASEDAQADEFNPDVLVADICTGSGCIACSLAYENPRVKVIATDIESVAVSLAKENVEALGLSDRVAVLEGDLGFCIPDRYMGQFDAIVSNPPYIPTQVMNELSDEVLNHEPALALDGGDDGLDVFRKMLPWCALALKPGGFVAFELHEECLEQAAAIAEDAGYVDVKIVSDLVGKPRVLVAVNH